MGSAAVLRSDGATEPLRLALVGWGAIGRTVAANLDDQLVSIVAVGVRDATRARTGLPDGAQLLTDPSELATVEPDLVVEAAGRDSVGPWARASLAAGADFVVSSVSALADPALLEELRLAAVASGTQLQIQPGALAGVEALVAARIMGIDTVEHRIVKPPTAWRDTPAESLCDLDSLDEPTAFFQASAPETASRFPKNANVAMTTALAGIGVDDTVITLIADPAATKNRHEIVAEGAFGTLDVSIANNPLPDNPKTSALAALSLVRLVQNRQAAIVI